jgi:hypothetical protein
MMVDPKIYLLQDTCFAIKRWVEPETWGPVVRQIGFDAVEESFDNEMDFFYTPKAYRDEWFKRLEKVETEQNIKVRSFFTGYQTYRTTGLTHPNIKMAQYLMDGWVKPAIEELGAHGLHIGFALNGFPEKTLQNPSLYAKGMQQLIGFMSEIGMLAKQNGGIYACTEAMHAPQMPPWTIDGTIKFLQDVYAKNNAPVYITIDVGHMIGQKRFLKPSTEAIINSIITKKEPWLGADKAYALWEKAVDNQDTSDATLQTIVNAMDDHSYLFSNSPKDGDPYAWIKKLGCYSPIMHMQQTDGIKSSHAAFTPKNNEKGIIEPAKVLKAIAESYEHTIPGMPPKAKEINLAFEIFGSNTEHPREIISKLQDTAKVWKQVIPRDGMRLSEILKNID